MTPSPKDRQNSGISMLEKEQAQGHLQRALDDVVRGVGIKSVVWEIRTAMAILGMEEPE